MFGMWSLGSQRFTSAAKTLAVLTAVGAAALVAPSQAKADNFSIGVGYSSGPVYRPAPVYCAPAPVYVRPAPVYCAPPVVYAPAPVYCPPPVVYRPAPVYYYAPAPVYAAPVYAAPAYPYRPAYSGGYFNYGHGGYRGGDSFSFGFSYRGH